MSANPHHARSSTAADGHSDRSTSSASGWWGHRWLRGTVYALGAVVVLLLVVHFAGSALITSMVNRKLASIQEFTGHVEAVRLAIWRGGVVVRDFQFRSRDAEGGPPMVHVSRASMMISVPTLFRGVLGGSAVVQELELNFVKREPDDPEEVGRDLEEAMEQVARWQQALKEAFPMELTRFEIESGHVRFIDITQEPAVNVGVKQFELTATDLRTHSEGEELPTEVRIVGETTGGGRFDLRTQADPFADPLRFETTFQLRGLNVPSFNNLLRSYTGMDVSRGTFDLDVQVSAEDGRYEGSTKPFFEDLEFESADDGEEPLMTRVAESAVDAVTGLLENEETDKVATAVPFSGTFEQGQTDLWTAVSNLLRNAFVEAIREGFRNQG